jgi:hypothetical protein
VEDEKNERHCASIVWLVAGLAQKEEEEEKRSKEEAEAVKRLPFIHVLAIPTSISPLIRASFEAD